MIPHLSLLPTAVIPGGQSDALAAGSPPAFGSYQAYYQTHDVFVPPSIVRASSLRANEDDTPAFYFPPTQPPSREMYHRQVTRAETPQINKRASWQQGETAARRVVYQPSSGYLNVRAPTLDEVRSFLSLR